MLNSAICLVSCSMAQSVLLLEVVAISLLVSYCYAAVIAAAKFAGSDTWTFIEYSDRSPWIKS